MATSAPSLPGRDGRNMGEATSTAAASDSAVLLHQAHHRLKGKTLLNQMRFVEFEGENLENEIFQLCCWISTTPIPTYFDENLQPRRPSNTAEPTRLMMVTTLAKYVGKIILYIREKFPGHPDFVNLKKRADVPEWWTRMRPTFEKECQRFHATLGSEFTFGDTTTQPLYQDNQLTARTGIDEDSIGCYLQKIDLLSILRKLFRDAVLQCNREGKLQQRCWLIFLHYAVGRGGEIKLNDYNDWMWHPCFEVTDIGWAELKLLQKYAMAMVPHRCHFLLDFYHALGCFWSVERGLFRAGNDELAIANYVFPDLHSCKDSQVTNKVTKSTTTCLRIAQRRCPRHFRPNQHGAVPSPKCLRTLLFRFQMLAPVPGMPQARHLIPTLTIPTSSCTKFFESVWRRSLCTTMMWFGSLRTTMP